MLFLPSVPYISAPALVAAFFGLTLLSLGYQPSNLQLFPKTTLIKNRVEIFVLYAVVHGVFIDLVRQVNNEQSVLSGEFIRQFISLMSGYLVYRYARVVFWVIDEGPLLRTLRWSMFVNLLLGAGALIALLLGLSVYEELLGVLRSIIIPVATPMTSLRATGFSTEPSYFGIILVGIYLPAVLAERHCHRENKNLLLWVVLMVANVLATASLTTFLTIGVVATYMASRKLKYLLFLLPLLMAVVLALLLASQDSSNYAALQFNAAMSSISGETESSSLSFVDTWYSYAGPLSSWDWKFTLGVGLGGTETHIGAVFPDAVAEMLRAATQKDRISVLVARVMVEQGVIGLALFLSMWWCAWKLAKESDSGSLKSPNTMLMRWAIVGCFAGYFLKLGSFSLPYMWVLFAFIETRHSKIQCARHSTFSFNQS